MSGRIPREFIDELLVRVDIVDLIDSHVPLKKAGSSFVARCPFHTEKSPSFSVSRKKQFYHCFGCGVGGNAISFLMEFSHLDFVEAIEDLADFVGIDVPRESSGHFQVKQDYSALYTILEQSAVLYVEQLRDSQKGKEAVKYLKKRGISGETAKEFSLGYAPDEWSFLGSQFDVDLLLKTGMSVNKEGGKTYDRFRGRLIFPIRDKRKRIIGFGGRVLDNSLPKYLNSPETPIFSKGKELYGLFELLEKSSKPKRILLVEGYMDVLALSQFGIDYSVAALGTAASKIHMDLLFRFTSEIVFCFDGDEAGKKAAWRAVQEAFPCLRDGRQVKVMLIPEGQDPDSLVRELGANDFEQKIKQSQTLSDYFIEYVCKDIDLATIEGRTYLVTETKSHIEKIPTGVFREMMWGKVAELSASPVHKNIITPFAETVGQPSRKVTYGEARTKARSKLSPIRTTIGLLLQNPQLIEVVNQKQFDLISNNSPGIDLLKEVLRVIEEIEPQNTAILLEYFRENPSEKIVHRLVNWDYVFDDSGVEAEFSDAFDRLIEHANENALNELLAKEKKLGLSKKEKKELLQLLVYKSRKK